MIDLQLADGTWVRNLLLLFGGTCVVWSVLLGLSAWQLFRPPSRSLGVEAARAGLAAVAGTIPVGVIVAWAYPPNPPLPAGGALMLVSPPVAVCATALAAWFLVALAWRLSRRKVQAEEIASPE